MSFLEELQKHRLRLQATTTTVTTATGQRYIENRDKSTPLMLLEPSTYGFVIDTKPDSVPACILDEFLYLGSQDAVTTENICNYKLTHILSVGIDTPHVANNMAIDTKYLPCLDVPETELFESVVTASNQYISSAKERNGRVLVHCNAGVSRAASIVIAYLMLEQGMHFEEAYGLVKSKRECIQPNEGFMKQLRNYRR